MDTAHGECAATTSADGAGGTRRSNSRRILAPTETEATAQARRARISQGSRESRSIATKHRSRFVPSDSIAIDVGIPSSCWSFLRRRAARWTIPSPLPTLLPPHLLLPLRQSASLAICSILSLALLFSSWKSISIRNFSNQTPIDS